MLALFVDISMVELSLKAESCSAKYKIAVIICLKIFFKRSFNLNIFLFKA